MNEDNASGADRRTLLASALGGVLIASSGSAEAARGDPVARTLWGRVRGVTREGVHVFKGIRYGADTQPRRFLPPATPTPWRDIRPATEYGPSSPQRRNQGTSEDCLFLNVWTPGLRDNARRPVMVYLHGGAHSSGSGSSPSYDGVNLCRRGDVVVVTINHRLNAFGYTYFFRLAGADYANANVGTLDIIQALQWVRDNIAEFGGDPGNVMIFGQSGGGGKVDTLMTMPRARGLFHRAATMSGSSVRGSGPLDASRRTAAYMRALGLEPNQVNEARALPTERLVEALATPEPAAPDDSIIWGPTLDHQTLHRHPFWPDATPLSADIPMLIGSTHDETRGFLRSDPIAFNLTWEQLPDKLAAEMVADIGPEYVMARYREIYPNDTPSQILFRATTASRSWRGHLEKAQARAAQGNNTWVYQVDYQTPVDGGRLGAPHTIDIGLVFDTTDVPESRTGSGANARAAAAFMSNAFVHFARSGNPNGEGVPNWPTFDLAVRRTMIFDVNSRVENDPRGQERQIFSIVPYYKPGAP